MKLGISSILDRGNIEKERIAFLVKVDCNLKFFIVHYTSKTSGGFYNQPFKTFWFPPKDVKANDYVVIYTKVGEVSSRTNSDGTSSHFFYLGLPDPLLNKDSEGVVLAEANIWETMFSDK